MAISITTIPAPYRAGFTKIKGLSPSDFELVATALEKASVAGGLKGLTSAVIERVPKLKRQETETVLRTLFSLSVFVTDEDTSLSENISSLATVIQTSGIPNLALSDEERSEFERRLERLLRIKAVSIASKVQKLGYEYPNTFREAMILTDMRPVFDKPEDRPVGCTISHTLQIQYHEGSDHKEFYVTLDADDLESLKKAVQRAETKASSIKTVLKMANLPDLS